MIIVDANQLRRMPSVRNRMWVLLRGLAAASEHAIATADVIFEEFAAGLTASIEEAERKRSEAERAFSEFSPSLNLAYGGRTPDQLAASSIADFRREVRILETRADSYVEAFRREVWRVRPASLSWDKPGIGARDVILWLSALEVCKTTGDLVYFVSDDATAFGVGGLYPELEAEVNMELGERASDFIFCRNIADLLSRLVEQSSSSDEGLLFELFGTDKTVLATIGRACIGYWSLVLDKATGHLKKEDSGYSTRYSSSKSLTGLQEVKSYRVGGHEWLVATMIWTLAATITELTETGGQSEPAAVGLEGSQEVSVNTVIEVLHQDDRPRVESIHLLSLKLRA